MTLLYLCLLASYVVYLYYRIRYTLKEAVNQGDPRNNARYKISPYAIVSVCIEALSMAAMAIYAGDDSYRSANLPAHFGSSCDKAMPPSLHDSMLSHLHVS